MENLKYSMGIIKEKTPWPEPKTNGPSVPKINIDQQESNRGTQFLHPAEKPQFSPVVYRTKLVETLN